MSHWSAQHLSAGQNIQHEFLYNTNNKNIQNTVVDLVT